MLAVKTERFTNELENITLFIAEDSINRALKFIDDLDARIEDLADNPKQCKKSCDNEEVRELIFRGYTIPYLIGKDDDTVVILGIFNRNEWEL